MRMTFPLTSPRDGNACLLLETGTTTFAVVSHSPSRTPTAPSALPGLTDVKPAAIDFILLAHARAGQGGFLPDLVDRGFSGPIYGSHDTIDALARGRIMSRIAAPALAGTEEDRGPSHPFDPTELDRADTLDQCLEQVRRVTTGREFAPHVGLRCKFLDLWPGEGAHAVEVAATEWGLLTKLLYLRLPAQAPSLAPPALTEGSAIDVLVLDLGGTARSDPHWLRPWLRALPQQPDRTFVLNGPVAPAPAWTEQLRQEYGSSMLAPEPGHRELWPEFLTVP